MECYNTMGKKFAPEFMGTAKKNIKWFGNDIKLKQYKVLKIPVNGNIDISPILKCQTLII